MSRMYYGFIAASVTAWPALARAQESAAHEASHAAEAGPHPVTLVTPYWGSAVWTIILFGLLVFVLGKWVWPHVQSSLDAREKKIRDDISSAEKANAEAQQTLDQYKKQLAEAHAEARKIIDQSRTDAEQLRARRLEETEQELGRLRQRATDDIEQAKEQAISDLYAQAGELATAVASKILQRQITEQDTRTLVEQSLGELNQLHRTG